MLKEFKYNISSTGDVDLTFSENNIDKSYNNFPQILHLHNLKTSIEFNKFLLDKFRFNNFNISGKSDKISLLRIKSIQNSLTIFLNWVTENNINWKDELAVSDETPIHLYRNHLINLIIDNKILYSTSLTYLGDIRMLYEWAVHKNIISKLPFDYTIIHVKNYNSKLINSKGAPSRQVVSANLKIPKKYKDINIKKLSAYSEKEYQLLINCDYCKTPARQLWIKLAKEYGLRRIEIINLNEDILNYNNNGLYKVIGKFQKKREIYFKQEILKEIQVYCNIRSRKIALDKYYIANGYTDQSPLFLNNKGERITPTTISNIIYPARDEIVQSGYKFNKTFHDLRATYAVERVTDLMKQGLDFEHIQFVISDELGHNLFETTKKYLMTKKVRENCIDNNVVGRIFKDEHLFGNSENKGLLDDFL